MRQKLRIPIACNYFHQPEILQRFLKTEDMEIVNRIIHNYTSIMLKWKKSPDMRFGQLLCCMRFIPNSDIENHIWNIEEDDWLIKNGYCNIEDIRFWGVNYYKNGKLRKKIKFKLLKDLDLDHIKNIILFFEKANSLHRLNKQYLEYFNKRIENGK